MANTFLNIITVAFFYLGRCSYTYYVDEYTGTIFRIIFND